MIDFIKSLNLDKPICVFDLETTGLDPEADRIVQIAITKIMPDGTVEYKSALINPLIPIKKEAFEVHGISNEDVLDKRNFRNISKALREFFGDCYLLGFNNNWFDNELLAEEFSRCDIPFPNQHTVSLDACAIFKHFEKRDLAAAFKFYCNKDIENAHDAENDTAATKEVFFAQLQKYDELKGKTMLEISQMVRNQNFVDTKGRIIRDAEGDCCWNFGKAKGKKIKNELGFGDWVLMNNFPQTFKNLVIEIMADIKKKK